MVAEAKLAGTINIGDGFHLPMQRVEARSQIEVSKVEDEQLRKLLEIIDILACPACRNRVALSDDGKALICEGCGRRYRIWKGIPIMLLNDIELPEEECSSEAQQDAKGNSCGAGS